MNKAEWDLIVTDEAERDVHTLVQDKKAEEINTMTAEVIACTDEIKTRYQLIKGCVCDLMTKQLDFEKALKKIHKEASRYWDFECASVGCPDCCEAEESILPREDAIKAFSQEAYRLRGILHGWQEYSQDVGIYCNIYLKAVFGRKVKAMKLPEPLIGRRCEDGAWDLSSCRKRFMDQMLSLIDHYDGKTMPFRTTYSEEYEVRSEYFDVTVNRKALTKLLNELYELDEDTTDRLEMDDYGYFVEVAHAFINVAARVMTPKGREAFFAHYGIEDGTRKSLAELAEKYGVTRERIRQLIDKEARKLKHPLHRREILLLPDSEAED